MIWFVCLPGVVFIMAFVDPWVRFKIVEILSLCIDFLGFIVFVYLFWPSRAMNIFLIKTPSQLIEDEILYDDEL